jgi:hypothetical protein
LLLTMVGWQRARHPRFGGPAASTTAQ